MAKRRKTRKLDLSAADPVADGLSADAARLAKNMRVELFAREEGEEDPLEAVVDFLMAVWLRRRARGNVQPEGGPDSQGGRAEGEGHAEK
jgi:hypothetical protein